VTRTEPRRSPDPAEQAARRAGREVRNRRAERVEERLAVPVIIAAAVSVPAVFLSTVTEGTSARVGTALNWASLAVLSAESVLLFLLTGDRLAWLWRHRWKLAILAVAVPAVALTVAPAQSLRLVVWTIRFFGALRVLRAGRIIRAGRVLARRFGWVGRWRHLAVLAGSAVAAVLVAIILADDTSTTRLLLERADGWPGLPLVLAACALLAVATFVVVRYRRSLRRDT
jgi:hypothetical protein